jgi:hypothetical protein
MNLHVRALGSQQAVPPARTNRGRGADRPVFWWSAGGIFLVNAWISAAEGRWVLAALQFLTTLWATVAGVTAWLTPPEPHEYTGHAAVSPTAPPGLPVTDANPGDAPGRP